MSYFQREVAGGQVEHVNVPDELDAWHLARGYVQVTPDGVPVDVAVALAAEAAERAEVEAQVSELTGESLAKAVKAAKIEHPSSLSADEKRAALVEQVMTPSDNPDED